MLAEVAPLLLIVVGVVVAVASRDVGTHSGVAGEEEDEEGAAEEAPRADVEGIAVGGLESVEAAEVGSVLVDH